MEGGIIDDRLSLTYWSIRVGYICLMCVAPLQFEWLFSVECQHLSKGNLMEIFEKFHQVPFSVECQHLSKGNLVELFKDFHFIILVHGHSVPLECDTVWLYICDGEVSHSESGRQDGTLKTTQRVSYLDPERSTITFLKYIFLFTIMMQMWRDTRMWKYGSTLVGFPLWNHIFKFILNTQSLSTNE